MSASNPSSTITEGYSSTSTPAATSPQTDSDTTTLYLFTFLATILILVLLSTSLVLRSYILRRRYRQRLQQALADGLFDHNLFHGPSQFDSLGGFRRSTRRIGPKPVLWDTWIHPADTDNAWSSITPVAVRCNPSLSPSTSISQPSATASHGAPSRQAHTRSFFSQLRLPNPLSLSSPPSSSLPKQPHTPIESPNVTGAQSLPPGSAGLNARIDGDDATLAVCMLVAMPDASAPVHRSVPDAKGKGVDPGVPSSLHRSGSRIPDAAAGEEGTPLLEFGVVEMRTGEWAWRTRGA